MKNFFKQLIANPAKAFEFLQWLQIFAADAYEAWEAFRLIRRGRKQFDWYETKLKELTPLSALFLDSIPYEKIEQEVNRRQIKEREVSDKEVNRRQIKEREAAAWAKLEAATKAFDAVGAVDAVEGKKSEATEHSKKRDEAEARKAEAGNAMVTAAHRRQEEVQRNREALTKPIPSNGPLHFTPLGDKKDD